jgi:hypothetical protein
MRSWSSNAKKIMCKKLIGLMSKNSTNWKCKKWRKNLWSITRINLADFKIKYNWKMPCKIRWRRMKRWSLPKCKCLNMKRKLISSSWIIYIENLSMRIFKTKMKILFELENYENCSFDKIGSIIIYLIIKLL